MFDKLDDLLQRFEEIMNELAEPGVTDNQQRFRALMKEQSSLTPLVEAYKEYKKCKQDVADSLAMLEEESDEEMRDMLKEELSTSRKRIEELENKLKVLLLPKDPNDDKNVIMEIRAGTGGDEAALFAAEIYRMYVHYAEARHWKIETMDMEEIGIGGMKSVTFMINGQGAYSIMKYESGTHRVQRVPETESAGRIHTSAITVAVMPEAEEVDVQIDEKDIKIRIPSCKYFNVSSTRTSVSCRGQSTFLLTFLVNKNVLCPRQDTEVLVEETLKYLHDGMRILDIGTGSGCILLSLLHYSNDCTGVGADISEEALCLAKENAARLSEEAAEFIESNLFEKIEGKFEIIVSNPPYIRSGEIAGLMPEVRDYESHGALDGGGDGLFFYREITKQAKDYLTGGGMLFYEIGFDQGDAVREIIENNGFLEIEIVKDFSGHDRVVRGTLY